MIKEIVDIDVINSFLKEFNTSIDEIGVFSHYKVYIDNTRIVGFLNYDLIYNRIEIDYIYVVESYRKKGIASKLLEELLMEANENNCENITLEVRKSNNSAINFYKKNLFNEVANRVSYYGNEDGILMIRELV